MALVRLGYNHLLKEGDCSLNVEVFESLDLLVAYPYVGPADFSHCLGDIDDGVKAVKLFGAVDKTMSIAADTESRMKFQPQFERQVPESEPAQLQGQSSDVVFRRIIGDELEGFSGESSSDIRVASGDGDSGTRRENRQVAEATIGDFAYEVVCLVETLGIDEQLDSCLESGNSQCTMILCREIVRDRWVRSPSPS